MKKEYWDVEDSQVIEKTGKKLDEWMEILANFDARNRKSNEVVPYLQSEYNTPRYWARVLTTYFIRLNSKD